MRTIWMLGIMALVASGCSLDSASGPGLFAMDDAGTGQWKSVSTGLEHTCALDTDGRAWCWGSNAFFQLGVQHAASTCGAGADTVNCSPVPVPVESGRTFSSISAGGSHTCAISTDSVPFCWGSNRNGQLGTNEPGGPVLRLPGATSMIAISAGLAHTCGIRADGVMLCWGSDLFGAVGTSFGDRVPPSIVGGARRYVSVAASDHRTCARTTAARVECWGSMWTHSVADTNFALVRSAPGPVDGLGTMSDVAVGSVSTCAIDATGFAWCWESNVHGESGTGTGEGSTTPRRVASDISFAAVTVGASHACAIAMGGQAWCWGSNRSGQLGSVSTAYCGVARTACSLTPVAVSGQQRFISISAGVGSHVCGVTDHSNLYCWGAGGRGQRGDGSTSAGSRVPRLAVVVHGQ